jgi:hypothetical protein
MNDFERYLFDLQGYLHIPGLISANVARRLHSAALELERHAVSCQANSPRWRAVWGNEYWQNQEYAYFASLAGQDEGKTLIVEDFWHLPDAFDFLIGHERTMEYIRRIVQGPISINNSELRIRYPNNYTRMHSGHPSGRGAKYRYEVIDGEIHASMVRMIYFLHDVSIDEGPTCFVPGSHRGAFPVPAAVGGLEDEPGLVGVAVKAGDGILLTEACRHGGLANRGQTTRYTLHVGYGPHFLKSQNISTMDEEVHATDALLERLTESQRTLIVCERRRPIDDSS